MPENKGQTKKKEKFTGFCLEGKTIVSKVLRESSSLFFVDL